MFKYFLVAVFLISQLLYVSNSNADSVKSMVLLNDNQLSSIDAKGAIKSFTKIGLQYGSKIILWDEQTSSNNNGQIQTNGGLNGNYASSINNIGLVH